MFFNKKRYFFYIVALSLLLLSHCGLKNLRIGEKPIINSQINLETQKNICSNLNYKGKFSDYFFKEQKKHLTSTSSGRELEQVFTCVRSQMKEWTSFLDHDELNKNQLKNLFDHSFIKTENLADIIEHILNPKYFNSYILVKNRLIYTIAQRQNGASISIEKICGEFESPIVFKKQEVEVLDKLIENFSEMLLSIEISAYDLHSAIFQGDSLYKDLSFSDFKKDDNVKDLFIYLLSVYFEDKFPDYAQKLKSLTFLGDSYEVDEKVDMMEMPKLRNELLQPLIQTAELGSVSSDKITVQNVKYLLLNIYLTQLLISTYDSNQDATLDSKELSALHCSISPILSMFVPSLISSQLQSWDLKGWDDRVQALIESHYSADILINYILYSQEIPITVEAHLDYLLYRRWNLTRSGDFSDLSASRLIADILTLFFQYKGKFLLENPSSLKSDNP